MIIWKCYDIPFVQGITASMLSHFIIYTADNVVGQAASTYSPLFDRRHFYTFITIILPKLWAFFIAFVVAYVLRKSGFYRYFASLFSSRLRTVLFMAMYASGQEKIHMQEETISQQQAHMELLEELQLEIRAFRHDVTNLFSGLALQAQEGDLDGIQEFMRKTSSYFDEKLGNEIKQMDCLNNIRLYPVRSLLTAKLAAIVWKIGLALTAGIRII